ncbi:hypothetical protein GNP84_19830 [Aliivibrio fischeri]|uniref:bacteriophage abortive infection AbiH family protein n=1 Tax=Aliivibrio fischeri TaxID=668 RepID=UPI0012D9A8F7|nr:bacteriophage abortive infection AbiH family protein [Aliivibrio fischeri]MUK79125.1 hypothetical protein [Aliivibrio fischeri]
MKILYIIGNGFDLWHGLPTSYSQFYDFAKETLDDVENYYLFDLHDHEPWHDFENALGAFCWEDFYDYHNEVDIQSDDFKPSHIYGLEDELTEQTDLHVESIKESFLNWVEQIDVNKANEKMVFPENSHFINFNYTSSLQLIYGIENEKIFHIHGQAKTSDELIFGHGKHIVNKPEIDENGESTRSMFSDAESAAKYPLFALRKPVDELLEQYNSFFEQLHDIEKIVVIGHSINVIDLPYFKRLAEQLPTTKWKVCCYTENEKIEHLQKLINININKELISMCSYDEL